MDPAPTLLVEPPRMDDALAIKAIQDSWIGARVGSEGFLVHALSLPRIEELIRLGNVLVARRGGEILSYAVFFRKQEWESMHPGYARKLDYLTEKDRHTFQDPDYVLVDYIARNKTHRGDSATRLVRRLTGLLRERGTRHLLAEISPENSRSSGFFTRMLGGTRIASTRRDGIPWDVYAAVLRNEGRS